MKRKVMAYVLFCLIPMMGFTESSESEESETDLADNSSDETTEWASNETSPKTNPRWFRNSDARKAYLRGDKDVHSYPRQSDSKTGNQSVFYRRQSN